MSQPLSLQDGDINPAEAAAVKRSFLIMCISFSLNLGAVTTVISFAGPDFPGVGNTGTGVLYSAYCLSALFLAPMVTGLFGMKRILVIGLVQYCVYLLAYVLADFVFGVGKTCPDVVTNSTIGSDCVPITTPTASLVSVILGAFIGGLGSGYLWPAQGAYFAASATKYAELTGESKEQVNGRFASIFAGCFLSSEIAFKFIGGGIKLASPKVGTKVMYIVLLGIGVVSVFGMTLIKDIKGPAKDEGVRLGDVVKEKISSACKLLASDPRMLLMLPFEVSFGVAGSFLNAYISTNVTASVLPGAFVGFFAGIVSGSAVLVSFFGGWFIQKYNQKTPLMFAGCVAFGVMAGPFIFYSHPEDWKSDDSLSYVRLVVAYVAMGIGRGIFESTNKAVIADFFSTRAPAAFANVIWSSGGSAAIGYLGLKLLPGKVFAFIVTASSGLALVAYLFASRLPARNEIPEEGRGSYQPMADEE